MAEEGVGQAPGQGLLGPIQHEDQVREPGQAGIPPLGEAHDSVAVLLGVTHVV